MKSDSLTASVNYGDYEGTVSADHHDQKELKYLAEKYGIDTDRYFIIGVQLYIGETHGDALGAVSVSLIATDTQTVNAYGVGPISDWVKQNGGTLPYVRFDIDANIEEVLLSFKRFEVVLTNSHLANVRRYKSTLE